MTEHRSLQHRLSPIDSLPIAGLAYYLHKGGINRPLSPYTEYNCGPRKREPFCFWAEYQNCSGTMSHGEFHLAEWAYVDHIKCCDRCPWISCAEGEALSARFEVRITA